MRAAGVVILAVFATSAQAACSMSTMPGGCDSNEYCDGSTCTGCRLGCKNYKNQNTPTSGEIGTWYAQCKVPSTAGGSKTWGTRYGGCCSHGDCTSATGLYCAKQSGSSSSDKVGICTRCTGASDNACTDCDTIEQDNYASTCGELGYAAWCGGTMPATCQCQKACTSGDINKAVAAFASWIIVILVIIPLLCICGCIAFCFCTGAMCFKASQPQTVVVQGGTQQPMYQKQ